jgi:hypothetical protein
MKDRDATMHLVVGLVLALGALRLEAARTTWRRRALGAARVGVGGIVLLHEYRGHRPHRHRLPTSGVAR